MTAWFQRGFPELGSSFSGVLPLCSGVSSILALLWLHSKVPSRARGRVRPSHRFERSHVPGRRCDVLANAARARLHTSPASLFCCCVSEARQQGSGAASASKEGRGSGGRGRLAKFGRAPPMLQQMRHSGFVAVISMKCSPVLGTSLSRARRIGSCPAHTSLVGPVFSAAAPLQ